MVVKCPNCHSEILDDSRFCSKCGTPIQATEEELEAFTRTLVTPSAGVSLGSLLAGKYRVQEEIGRGGMGIVYKAEDMKLKRTVAIKFLPREWSSNPEARERFVQEARAAAALSHPNICTIHEVDDSEDKPFIVMEYVEGENLREKLRKGPLPVEDALDIVIPAAEGLDKAHQKGIVHRDVKSANIMVTESGQAKIMDFGLAKLRGGTALTQEGATLGTVAYMSPEQARGEKVDGRSDIWSLGVVLYETLTGELPFKGERDVSILYSIVHEEPIPLKVIKPDIPPELERIVRRALEKKPELRYHSAGEMSKDLKEYQEILSASDAGLINLRRLSRHIRKPQVAIPALIILLAIVFLGIGLFKRQARVRWANEVLIPQIQRNADAENYHEAFRLAVQAKEVLGDAPALLANLWPSFSILVSLTTEPQQARVYRKPYVSPDAAWELVGLSPLEKVRFSRDAYRLKIEKDGYQTVEDMRVFRFGGTRYPENTDILYRLDRPDTALDGMVHVLQQTMTGVATLDSQVGGDLGDYWIDRFEVVNEDYKRFVDSGGYNRVEFWKIPFLLDGKSVSWPEAMKIFRDQTGRPGPASWESGTFPEGQGRFPVRGVSWYEAAAYAEFAGKSLPTIQHWSRAAGLYCSNYIIPLSNFGHGGPAAVGTYRGMGPFGVYDMAGNVKEWCWNEAEPGLRYILGGGWDEPAYMFNDIDAQMPWVRSAAIGFRCVKYSPKDASLEQALSPVARVRRDYSKENPASDKAFEAYKGFYSYDKLPLNPNSISRDSSSELWVKETVSFSAAYGNDERVTAYLFLPKHGQPPFQVVIYFPGSNALLLRSSKDLEVPRFDFVIKSGRALMYPVYKSTYERGDGLTDDVQNTSILFRDHVLMWAKDVGRSIDYLETRADIDTQHLAYLGFSWGGVIGSIVPAIEKRIRVNVLVAGGLDGRNRTRPEVDGVNFLPRITQPTLMLNGAYDYYFPEKTCQEPMFRLLGTPSVLKRKVVFEAGHSVPRVDVIREVLAWFDKYMGQ
jgi:serine/threonine protein kinase